MNYLFRIYTDSDIYEISVDQGRLTRIMKFVGESEFPREVLFENLPEDVKNEILKTYLQIDDEK